MEIKGYSEKNNEGVFVKIRSLGYGNLLQAFSYHHLNKVQVKIRPLGYGNHLNF